MKLSYDEVETVRKNLLQKYKGQLEKARKLTAANSNSTKNLTTVRYYNRSNGVYIISVSSVDEVGNISEPSSKLFIQALAMAEVITFLLSRS